jgi:hypothetical protein
MRHKAFVVVAALLMLTSVASLCKADPITYVEEFTASGILDGTDFTAATVALTLVGDTAVVTGSGTAADPFTNTIETATVDVAGLGADTFTDSMEVQDDRIDNELVLNDLTSGFGVLLMVAPAFASYDLTTNLGPVSGERPLPHGSS